MTEKEYLKNYDASKYPRPSLTADVVALSIQDQPTGNFRKPTEAKVSVLLVKRGGFPFKGQYALPGGFSRPGERIEETAARELREETGLVGQLLVHVDVFSAPKRDPRGWIISSAYVSIVAKSDSSVRGGDDAESAEWIPIEDVLRGKVKLAFDHMEIVKRAIERLRPIDRDQFAFAFMPPEFTLSELQKIYEFLDGHALATHNFRRKILARLAPVKNGETKGAGHRPAALYRQNSKNKEG